MNNPSNNDKELIYKIALSLIHGIGGVLSKEILAYCGSSEAVFKEKKTNLVKIPGIGQTLADAIVNQNVMQIAEEEIDFINKNNITPLFYTDKDYPVRLKTCVDSPIIIYYKGNTDLNAEKIVSIVGTRNATEYGKDVCNKLVEDLAIHNVMVVSGLAYGVDICAHKAALNNHLNTVGVLGHALDIIYPSKHKSIADKMIIQGGLITEFHSKASFAKENFPRRNRIIAGMADAVIIIESKQKGGALLTANIANSYNRDVFAVPGRLSDRCSDGCNNLIKTNRACLIENAKDIEYIMGWDADTTNNKVPRQKELFVDLSVEETSIVNILKATDKLTIDDICLQSKLSMSKVSSSLLNLEFNNLVKCLPGKVYMLN